MANEKQVIRESPARIPSIIRAHWNSVPKEPVHLIGEPSTVKSEGVYQEARALAEGNEREFFDWNRSLFDAKQQVLSQPGKYFVFADVRASETDIGELRLQDMRNGEDFISFKYNLLFKVLSQENAMGVLFFDEMNLAPNMIKAQFYKLINDRCIGDIPLADGVMCVSAGNEAGHARGVTEDPVPLVLRRGNYFIRPLTVEEYSDFAVRTGQHPHVVAYLQFAPQNVHKIRYDLQESSGQPCPRTWTKLSRVLRSNPDMDDDLMLSVARGLVGQGVAAEFMSFVKLSRKVRIEDILKEPKSIQNYDPTDNNQLSLLWSIVSGVVSRVGEERKLLPTGMEIATYVQKSEIGVFMGRQLKNVVGPDHFRKYMSDAKNAKSVDPFIAKYGKFLVE